MGVFSRRLPVGQSVAGVGVLGPEDQVSLNDGGVEDEHGVVRCCVGASVDDGALLWQGAEGFQKRLGSVGRVSNAAGGEPTGFWHGPAAHNVLVDELITGTHLRRVVELGLQGAGVVAAVAGPRISVAHWDHRPVFAQWPVPLDCTQFYLP